MSLSFFKPNKNNTGTVCGVDVNIFDDAIYFSILKQASWDESTKKGSFKANSNDPTKKINLKMSLTEVGSIIDAINNKVKFSAYHSTDACKVQIIFSPYPQQDVENPPEIKGYSLYANRTIGEEKATFQVGFYFGEAELLKQYLIFALQATFQAQLTNKLKSNEIAREAIEQIKNKPYKDKGKADDLLAEPAGLVEEDNFPF